MALAATAVAAGAWGLTRYLGAMLYGVTALDGVTFSAAALVLVAVALAASLVPARKASRVDPVVALREIAAKTLKPDEVKEEYIRSLQKHAEVDEPEETRPEADNREDPSHRQVTEEELLRALTTEAQRRAEPQPEPEADYEE